MKKHYFALFLLIALSASAQNFEWLNTPAITFSYNSDGIGYPTATDSQGNTFVCGFKENAMAYTDIFGTLWLLKYNSNGQLLFSKTITGTVNAYKMQTDTAGNLYILAAYINDIAIDGLNITTTWQGVKPILLKLDTNGNLLWHKPITTGFIEHAKALTIDSNQNVYIGYDDYGDSYIEKLDANGNSLQLITQTRARLISSVSIDTEGNIYAAGSCAETVGVSFNGTAVANSLGYNTYVVKYNASGQMQWIHFVEDITCPEPQVIARTPDEVYFCSYLFGNFVFGSITTEGPTVANTDFFLAKLNSSGEYQWVKEVLGNGDVELGHRNFLTLDAAGNIYLAARIRGAVQWGATVSTNTPTYTHDLLVLKYNPQGDVLWAKTAGGDSEDRTDGITVLADNNIIISGMVTGTVAFDGLSHSASASSTYPYVAKLSTATLGIPNPTAHITFVYPNPAHNSTTLKTEGYRGPIQIYTLLGQLLQTVRCTSDDMTIDTSTLPTGSYLIRLDTNEVLRFVKV